MAMSTRIETRMAKANAAPICTVNTVVWVMNPGPIALVAMRNMAPREAAKLVGRSTALLSMLIPRGVGEPLGDIGHAAAPDGRGRDNVFGLVGAVVHGAPRTVKERAHLLL